jgi:RNA polymerase sigma-70 factor, ECF subfamily
VPDPQPFADLLAAAQAGSDRAVAALYGRHNPKLLRYLRAQAPGEGDDLAAETWLDAARSLHRFRGDEDAFAGWLFTIARRRLVDHRRARYRRPVDPAPEETVVDRVPAAGSAEADAFDTAFAEAEARRLVALLPPDHAEVLLLRLVAGLDVETVAAITGRKPGSVRVTQHRALRRLADALAGIGALGNGGDPVDDGTEHGTARAEPPPR